MVAFHDDCCNWPWYPNDAYLYFLNENAYKTTGLPGDNIFLTTAKLNDSPVSLTITEYFCVGAALDTWGVFRGTSYLAFFGSYIYKK